MDIRETLASAVEDAVAAHASNIADSLREAIDSLSDDGEFPTDEESRCLRIVRDNYWDESDLDRFATFEDQINEWWEQEDGVPYPHEVQRGTAEERALLDLIRTRPGLGTALTTFLKLILR